MAISQIYAANFRPSGSAYVNWTELASNNAYMGFGYYNSGQSWSLGIKFTIDAPIGKMNFTWASGNFDYSGNKKFNYKILTNETDFNYCVANKDDSTLVTADGVTPSINAANWASTEFSLDMVLSPGTYYLLFWRNSTYDGMGIRWDKSVFKVEVEDAYLISYDANGGTGTTASQIVKKGDKVNLRANSFTPHNRQLYTVTLNGNGGKDGVAEFILSKNSFHKWREGPTSGTGWSAEAEYTPQKNITLYAWWRNTAKLGTTTRDSETVDGYKVSFNANGGSCNTSSLTAKDVISYAFKEWNANADGTGNSYNSTSEYWFAMNIVRYAQWTPTTKKGSITLPTPVHETFSTATVVLDYRGATANTSVSSKTYQKKIAKAFNGWAKTSTATSGNKGTYTPDSTQTLYAIWGGSTTSYGTITNLPIPEKTGYEFKGWAEKVNATSGAMGSYTPTSEITVLYAIWEPKGNIRIYTTDTGEYKMALAYIHDGTSWKLALLYLHNGAIWKIVSG